MKTQSTDANASKTETTKGSVKTLNGATSKKEEATEKKTASQIKELTKILTPTAKARINRLETLKILAEKFENVSTKYDELTNFMASNDNTNLSMRFSSDGYSFTLKNPNIINKILLIVEGEFSVIVEKAETEVLEFNI